MWDPPIKIPPPKVKCGGDPSNPAPRGHAPHQKWGVATPGHALHSFDRLEHPHIWQPLQPRPPPHPLARAA